MKTSHKPRYIEINKKTVLPFEFSTPPGVFIKKSLQWLNHVRHPRTREKKKLNEKSQTAVTTVIWRHITVIEMRNKYALICTLIKNAYGAVDYENHRWHSTRWETQYLVSISILSQIDVVKFHPPNVLRNSQSNILLMKSCDYWNARIDGNSRLLWNGWNCEYGFGDCWNVNEI